MNRFYHVLIIVSLFVALLYALYLFRMITGKYHRKYQMRRIREKDYYDAREYNRSYIASLLEQLKEGIILWIEILSVDTAVDRVSLSLWAGTNLVALEVRDIQLPQTMIMQFRSLGAKEICCEDRKLKRVLMPVNSKIVTDIVYLIFEDLLGLKKVYNLKFKY